MEPLGQEHPSLGLGLRHDGMYLESSCKPAVVESMARTACGTWGFLPCLSLRKRQTAVLSDLSANMRLRVQGLKVVPLVLTPPSAKVTALEQRPRAKAGVVGFHHCSHAAQGSMHYRVQRRPKRHSVQKLTSASTKQTAAYLKFTLG